MTRWDFVVRKVEDGEIGEYSWLKLYVIEIVVLQVKFFQSLEVDKLLHIDTVIRDVKEFQVLFEVD